MDPDGVARLVEELKLSQEAKNVTVHIETSTSVKSTSDLRRSLIGKVFSMRVVNRETLRIQVPKILHLRRSVDIEIVGYNLFVIVFGSFEDQSHALQDGPWHFFNSLMMFKAPIGFQSPSDVMFDEFSEVDVGEGGSCVGQFARVRICRPLSKPLQRCVRVEDVSTGESRIILLLYERLPDFYFACGQVGHVLRHCADDTTDKNNLVFGNWLRAARVTEVRRMKGGLEAGLKDRGSSSRGASNSMGSKEDTESRPLLIDEGAMVVHGLAGISK
ncbi:hypothetical protein C2S52_023433 [Perilla frutescens var. hirtella]|nr:hypothetical protein C2S52_023433 [Perilla frutescens var. hirtella]